MPKSKVVIMCTGSQGEPTSILGRLAVGKNRQFDVIPGDTIVLSSHPIPGNEESVSRTINKLFERGANVIYEAIAPVHVSGHASQEEMKLLLHLTKPKFFIPIHGELKHLKQHSLIAQEVGIPADNIEVILNGQTLELLPHRLKRGNNVPASYIFVDGSNVGGIIPDIMREREMMSQEGVVIVNLVLTKGGDIVGTPNITSSGFLMAKDEEEFISITRTKIEDAVLYANGHLQKDVEKAVRNVIYSETRRKPFVVVSVSELE